MRFRAGLLFSLHDLNELRCQRRSSGLSEGEGHVRVAIEGLLSAIVLSHDGRGAGHGGIAELRRVALGGQESLGTAHPTDGKKNRALSPNGK